MPERFDAEPVLAGLKAFQRATVDHVVDRFYGPDPTRRFLVADETGLGKSLVARGVIASTVERLQDDDSVDRIDIVYVCSNSDIAAQNISRLDVTGSPHLPFSSRLTLLAKASKQLAHGNSRYSKPINLVSFTPGTSFDMGWQTGMKEERALLYLILAEHLALRGYGATAGTLLLQGFASLENFQVAIRNLEYNLDGGRADEQIVSSFIHHIDEAGLLSQFEAMVATIGRRRSLNESERIAARDLTGKLRAALARASVATLEPDLVILDEFQRFRHLLAPPETSEAAELAHHLFDFGDARVLLLSATPYKPFTYAEEEAGGDNHFADVQQTLSFLAHGSSVNVDDITADLAAYRQVALAGGEAAVIRDRLQDRLLALMCRTERPQLGEDGMLVERALAANDVTADDLCGYATLRRLAEALDAPMLIEFWKSAPYFGNFLDGYQLGEKLRTALKNPAERRRLQPILEELQLIDGLAVEGFKAVDYGNARLRRLAEGTVEAGWWQLLWMPPSLPYTAPGGPYAESFAQDVTKRLVFSSWSATPTAVASLLSYDAERRIAEGSRLTENTPAARAAIASRLDYRLDGGRPGAMNNLALFWPSPALADACDPVEFARQDTERLLSPQELENRTEERLRPPASETDPRPPGSSESSYWTAALGPGALPGDLTDEDFEYLTGMLLGVDADDPDRGNNPAGLDAHVSLALEAIAGRLSLPPRPADYWATAAQIGLHGPANIAWRTVRRLAEGSKNVTPEGRWGAAAVIASGLRSLFNRPETIVLLDRLMPGVVYWRAVLQYCAWGNLQAVLDEYLHHFALAEGATNFDDDRLYDLAQKVEAVLTLRRSVYEAFDPMHPDERIKFTARFALRYGSRRANEESVRQPEIRRAFNSPFWPFVVVTTSVGQEGIDFHWWCHSVVHWNTPPNPVDFDQREGRVHRYAGHAIRRNIAAQLREEILCHRAEDPWVAAYEVAVDQLGGKDELAPHWIFPGSAQIERVILPYILSVDHDRLLRLKDDLALYRLAFGQPRQEDLVDLLRRRGVHQDPALLAELRLDLRPPMEPSVPTVLYQDQLGGGPLEPADVGEDPTDEADAA